MLMYGYEKYKGLKVPLELSEITLSCKKDELDKIIEFFKNIREESINSKMEVGDHWHYRDYNELWSEKESDLIVFLEENSNN